MSNNNTFRELSDKLNVAQSWCHAIVLKCLEYTSSFSDRCIKWPGRCEMEAIATVFERRSRIPNVIGAIDGCHILIKRPASHSVDYLNRKDCHSVLLQGICHQFMIIGGNTCKNTD